MFGQELFFSGGSMMNIRRFVTVSATVALAAGTILTTGCDKLTEALDIKVPTTITLEPESYNATLPKTEISCEDLSDNSDLMKYKDNISGGSVSSATLGIESLQNAVFTSGTTADQVFTNVSCTMTFDPSYGDTKVYTVGTLSDVKLSDMLNGNKVSIPVSPDFNNVVKLIPQRPKFCFNLSYGNLKSGPATASYIKGKLEIKINFDASPL
jgi:hypothetical protein